MSLDDYDNILSKLNLKEVKQIHLGGYGEPLLNKHLVEMIEAIPDPIFISTNTNLTINNDASVIALAQSKIDEINVSLDAFDKKIYEEIRVGSSWDKVMQNIALINAKKSDKLKLNLHSVVYLKNIHSYLQNISNFLQMISVDNIRFVGMKAHGSNDAIMEKSAFFSKEQQEFLKHTGKKNNIEITFNENKSLPYCFRPFNQLYVLFDGYVTPCCNIVDNQYYSFGNLLFEKSFENIWNSLSAIKFRKNLINKKPHRLCKTICNLKT
jgi:radical SAM protein with 4Fe4S-binding SPASM domain